MNYEESSGATPDPSSDTAHDTATIAAGVAIINIYDRMPDLRGFAAARVLAYVVKRAARRGGVLRVSNQQISRDLGLTWEQVRTAVDTLRQLPDMEIDTRRGRVTTWRLTDGGRT